ncbi:MAG: GDP-mannose 4,6-dehydratase, partial [Nitrososphaeria archaeon]
MVNVVITGGAGFIGSNLAVFLKSCGYNVMCIDNLSRSQERNVRLLSLKNIPLHLADIRDYNKVNDQPNVDPYSGNYPITMTAIRNVTNPWFT